MLQTTTQKYHNTGGSGRVMYGADGSVIAGGSAPGDWTSGYIVETQTIGYGGPQALPMYYPQPTQLYPQLQSYPQQSMGYPPQQQFLPQLPMGPYGTAPPQNYTPVGYAQSGLMPAPQARQIMPAFGPPPSYAQSEKQSKGFFRR